MSLSFDKNLAKLMLKHGNLSVTDLAKATGLPQPTLHQLYTGFTKKPRKKTLSILAKYFGVTPQQLLGEAPLPSILPETVKSQLDLSTAVIISWDELHQWPNIHSEHKQEIFLSAPASHTTFAMYMPDTTMEPLFPCGCLLIFDGEKPTKHNDCALVFLHKLNQFFFKKILTDGEHIYIQSLNPKSQDTAPQLLTKKDHLVATLREARLMF